MACISAAPVEKETPGFSRPSTQSHRLSRRSRSFTSIASGIHASAGIGKSKPFFITPITLKLFPSTFMTLFRKRCAAQERLHADHREKVSCYSEVLDFLRFAVAGQVYFIPCVRGQIIERTHLLFPIEIRRRRNRIKVLGTETCAAILASCARVH